jgi:hypothetical protein
VDAWAQGRAGDVAEYLRHAKVDEAAGELLSAALGQPTVLHQEIDGWRSRRLPDSGDEETIITSGAAATKQGGRCAGIGRAAGGMVVGVREQRLAAWRRWLQVGAWGARADVEKRAAEGRKRRELQAAQQAMANWLREGGSGTCSGAPAAFVGDTPAFYHEFGRRKGGRKRGGGRRRQSVRRVLDPEVEAGRAPDARGRYACVLLAVRRIYAGTRHRGALEAYVKYLGRGEGGRRHAPVWQKVGTLTAALRRDAERMGRAWAPVREGVRKRDSRARRTGERRSPRTAAQEAEREREARAAEEAERADEELTIDELVAEAVRAGVGGGDGEPDRTRRGGGGRGPGRRRGA